MAAPTATQTATARAGTRPSRPAATVSARRATTVPCRRRHRPRPPPIRSAPNSRQAPPPPRDQPRYGYDTPRAEPEGRRAGSGNFIDQELRTRVDGDIAAFLAAFDAALAGDTIESRSELREATDRLLRAGARTRIELERLEARVPLGSREFEGRQEPNWRHR